MNPDEPVLEPAFDGSEPVLEVNDLDISFPSEAGRVHAVRGLSYQVAPGEVLGIVGESGSGKSVSSMAVMGLLPPQARVSGSIRFRGTELLGKPDSELSRIRGRQVSMIFQDPLSALTPVYTVGDQVAEAVLVHGGKSVSKQQAAKRAVELLDLVGIPKAAERAKAFPHEFSGGMRQRVVIAMAIANDPDLIIADEPTTALDVTVQAQVLEVLKTAGEVTGASLVMITHDLGVVAGIADRVMVMYAGRTVETGAVDDIYRHPRMPYTVGLLGSIPRVDVEAREKLVPIEGQPPSMVRLPVGCPFHPRCPLAIDECRDGEPDLLPVDGLPGHAAACIRRGDVAARDTGDHTDLAEVYGLTHDLPSQEQERRPREHRPVVLEVRDLVRHYPVTKGTVFRRQVGEVRAVDGISFDVREGEALGIVGESGSGKTTTLMEILNLAAPTAGTIEVLGRDVRKLTGRDRKELRRDLQVVFQDPMASLDPRLPISDTIAEPMLAHGFDSAHVNRRVPELLDLVGLPRDAASRYPANFSGGQRQRVGIARALALEPKVLVLDEPVSALDVSIQAGVINLLEELQRKLGLAYLFVSHDLSVVRHIAHRVAVMYLGKVVEVGETDEVFRAPEHPYTQSLISAIPIPDPEKERRRERILLTGDVPSPTDPPSGCSFRTRCPLHAQLSPERAQRCIDVEPVLIPGTGGTSDDHRAACHYAAPKPVL
ncbi:ABC transporter ATP-binding protein [Pseudonocardia nigra]|uniref:ABC transporter ATP-binding protein n=1 Tax=Pseudonocardia nigra TaxID=1921578 RepID=UPI001C5E5278|nr:ABC transporter ATP-binding protein [Pseudonocardia nigra]